MLRLLHIEWIKTKSNIAFWVLLLLYIVGVYVLCSIGTGLITFTSNVDGQEAAGMPDLNMYNFPKAWHYLTYIGSYLKIFLGITIIVGISNELQHKTLRQNIIDGLSRAEFILTKTISSFLLAVVATVSMLALGYYFGKTYADTTEWSLFAERLDFVGAFFLQTFTFLTFSLLMGMLLRSTGLAIVFTLAYSFLLENFVIWIFLDSDGVLASLLPMNALDNLIQFPISLNPEDQVQSHVGMEEVLICAGWLLTNIGLSYFVLSKKDL